MEIPVSHHDARPEAAARATVQKLAQAASFLRAMINAVPSAMFVVEDDVRIYGYNRAATKMVGHMPELVLHSRAGEVLKCVHAIETPGGCGRSLSCKTCVVRNSTTAAFSGHPAVRQKATMDLIVGERGARSLTVLVTASPFEHEDTRLVLLLLEDIEGLDEFKTPTPACAQCKELLRDPQQVLHATA